MSSSRDVEAGPYKRRHTIGRKSTIGTYYKLSVLKQVRRILTKVGGRPLLDRFESGCFGQFIYWNPGQKCGMALHHVLSREITRDGAEDYDMWFQINGSHARFSNVEFALVTGLWFGHSDFDTTAEYDVSEVQAFKLFCRGGDVTIANLLEIFSDERKTLHDPNGESYYRVAHILVLYMFILAYDPTRYVDYWVWALVDDMEKFNSFPWGAYSFLTLKHYVKNISEKRKYHFHGPVWAFHVWSLEIIPSLAEVVAIKEGEDARPRFLRWKFRSRIKNDISSIFQQQADSVQPLQADAEERASVYMQSVLGHDSLGIVFEPPRNPVKMGERCRPRLHLLSEHSTSETERDINNDDDGSEGMPASPQPRRNLRKSKRTCMRKRSRPESSSSSASSGCQGEENVFSNTEKRLMKKTARIAYKEIKRRLLPKFKKIIAEVFESMRCSTRKPPVFEATPRYIPTPGQPSSGDVEAAAGNDGAAREDIRGGHDNERSHEAFIHVTPTYMPTSSCFSIPNPPMYGESYGRHSVHDIGHTFIPEGHVEIPGRHSVQEFGVGLSAFRNLVDKNDANQERNDENPHTGMFASDDRTNDIPIGNLMRRNPARRRVPGPALNSPYVNTFQPRPVPKKTFRRYQAWMTDGETSDVITKESAHLLGKSFFRDIELTNCDMDCSSVDLYLMHLRERLINKDHIIASLNEYNTVILDTDVFISLEECWAHLKDAGTNVINEWQPPPHILSAVQGKNVGDTMRSWYKAKQVIVVCFFSGHFVTVRISLPEWTAELYYSLYYVHDSGVQEFHEGKLLPLVKLFPKVLAASDFWDKCKTRLSKRDDPLTVKIPGPSFQQTQDSDKDCGPFALMYVERLISGTPNIAWGNGHVGDYRKKIAAMIFDLCYEETQ